MSRVLDAAVVGAGVSGLAAAENLLSQGREVACIEAAPRAGGALRTTREDGWLVEWGADAVLDEADAVLGLLHWLEVPVVLADPAVARRRWLVHRGRLAPLPRSPLGLLTTPLLSARGKLRLLREPRVAPGADEESLRDFLARRFGPETSAAAEAVATGVFAGDPDRLSVDAAYPALRRAEREHGSVLRGMRRMRRGGRRLLAPRDGMQALVEALAARVRPALGEEVRGVRPGGSGFLVETDRRTLEARRVILANGPAAGALLGAGWPAPRRAPVTVVALGYRAEGFRQAGFGWLAPHAEERFALGAVLEAPLFAGRAPDGHVLVRALVGGIRRPERAALSDKELVAGVEADVAALGLTTDRAVRSFVLRTPGIPQLELGHDLARRAAAAEARWPGLTVCGSGVRDVAVRGLVAEARAAADRALAR